jgi:two-component system sensor histidine kinase DesK
VGVLAFSAFHALAEIGRIATAADTTRLLAGVAATLVFLPLHLRHLWFGMRAQRPPHGALTLSVMAGAQVVGLLVVGPAWLLMLGALGCSALLVLAAPWSLAMLAACVAAPEVRASIAGLHGFFGPYRLSPSDESIFSYEILVLALAQFALVWMLAGVDQLRRSRDALARAAAEHERRRVRGEVQASLTSRLEGILDAGREVSRATHGLGGIAAPVIRLDRLLELSHGALSDLRRIVAYAREPVGESASSGLLQAARDKRTPVGRALTIKRARLACWTQYALWFAFPPLYATGVLPGVILPTSAPVVVCASAAMACLMAPLVVARMRGCRYRYATQFWWLMLAIWVAALPAGGDAWTAAGLFVAAAGAISFGGYRRVLPTIAITLAISLHEALAVLPHVPHLSALVWADQIGGGVLLALFIPAALAACPVLVHVLVNLEDVRDQLASHAAAAERRRVSSDLHDILGQSLTAISLKASVARELLIAGDRAGAAAEVQEVLELTEAQAFELDAVARRQRRVELNIELDAAVELLRAAQVDVTVHAQLEQIDETSSALLGWAIREGTTNILRHANANACEIAVERCDGQILLELRNDGVRASNRGGTGLAGLAERLAAAQGTATARPLPGGRFELRVELPA